MSQQQSEQSHLPRAGWFAVGALAASLAFVTVLVSGNIFASSNEAMANDQVPQLIIEAK